MFDLDQAIAEWRQEMLAAGIKTPVPLEELENHLREEIEQQMKLGISEPEAFSSAAQKIGQPGLLKTEFKKAVSFVGWLSENESTRINRVLGLLWLGYCSVGFYQLAVPLWEHFHAPDPGLNFTLLLVLLLAGLYLRGAIASILLIGGVMRERRVIMLIAILDAIGGLAGIILKPFSPLVFAFTILGLVSIWLLRPLEKTNLATK